MKKITMRTCAFVLMLSVLLSLTVISAPAAGTSQPANYSSNYNSGERDVVCTTLDGTSALSYYGTEYSYDKLSTMSESTLLYELRELMTDTHKKKTTYDDCKTMAPKTDCENGDGSILLLYTSYNASMNDWCDGGSTGWNREHVWPQSLGGFKTSGGGSDLHHLRPSDCKVNSTRGNMKYGNVSGGTVVKGSATVGNLTGGTYGSSYFEPNDNVKGDVARICLYVYVRWGGTYSQCSDITNVFQSVDVLLEWCENDPVDTWEMGRNEVVEGIQGNRNVFIDYPELAWVLFGEDIPDDMVTPSGEARNQTSSGDNTGSNNGNTGSDSGNTGSDSGNTGSDNGNTGTDTPCTHTETVTRGAASATCKTEGFSGNVYCKDCDVLVSEGDVIPKLPHTEGDWVIVNEATETEAGLKTKSCTVCGAIIEQKFIFADQSSGSFDEYVNAVLNADSYEDRFNCISAALNAYEALGDSNRAAVADEYDELCDIIDAYNSSADAANAEHNSVIIVALFIPDAATTTAKYCILPTRKEI